MCITFDQVAGQKKVTLGDIVPNGDVKLSKIQFLKPDGTIERVAFKGGEKPAQYVYWREKDDPEEGEGWYLNADEDGEINQNGREMNFGDAFVVNNQDGGAATFTFSGAVGGETTKTLTISGFNYIGNCMPKKITLGDITPNDGFKLSKIQFLKSDGTIERVAFKGGEKPAQYVYWREKDDPEEGPGWYLNADEDGEINQGETPILASQAFVVNNQDGTTASLTIPAAIPEK